MKMKTTTSTRIRQKDQTIKNLRAKLAEAKKDALKYKGQMTRNKAKYKKKLECERQQKLYWTKKLGKECQSLKLKLKRREDRIECMRSDATLKWGEFKRQIRKQRARCWHYNTRNLKLVAELEKLNDDGTLKTLKTRTAQLCEMFKNATEKNKKISLLHKKLENKEACVTTMKQDATKLKINLSNAYKTLTQKNQKLMEYQRQLELQQKEVQKYERELKEAYDALQQKNEELTKLLQGSGSPPSKLMTRLS
jgi:hypothetical protein